MAVWMDRKVLRLCLYIRRHRQWKGDEEEEGGRGEGGGGGKISLLF